MMIHDNGPQYRRNQLRTEMKKYGGEIKFTPHYSLQSNLTVRTFLIIKHMIVSYDDDNHKHRYKLLPKLILPNFLHSD